MLIRDKNSFLPSDMIHRGNNKTKPLFLILNQFPSEKTNCCHDKACLIWLAEKTGCTFASYIVYRIVKT
jgi:hypothetical protein